jgi:hypothetical protein
MEECRTIWQPVSALKVFVQLRLVLVALMIQQRALLEHSLDEDG